MHPDRIRAAWKLANLKADELLYDLDSGDGRVLAIAAREFGAKVVGRNVLFSWRRLLKKKSSVRLSRRFHNGNGD
jgi:cyclopropane fatty-acyl-phospholipid synthase-like methyltransferase